MFTGIVNAMGSVRRLTQRSEDAVLEVGTPLTLDDVRIGDSISVSGACLTVTSLKERGFTADVSAETLVRTTLKTMKAGDPVNIEKALRIGDRLGGHMVLGHVDGVGKILEKTIHSRSVIFCIEIAPELGRYIVAKGSIALDGISLTVNRCEKDRFYVNVIPHTAAVTTLGVKKASDTVNIETDILARHIEKLILGRRDDEDTGERKAGAAGDIDLSLLARHGFLK
ncbi:MAG: riboflavin synthase [Deltaproteobacteria bacterium]|nr:riboflavin synthase [Deltaproteobacteria bacterium]